MHVVYNLTWRVPPVFNVCFSFSFSLWYVHCVDKLVLFFEMLSMFDRHVLRKHYILIFLIRLSTMFRLSITQHGGFNVVVFFLSKVLG